MSNKLDFVLAKVDFGYAYSLLIMFRLLVNTKFNHNLSMSPFLSNIIRWYNLNESLTLGIMLSIWLVMVSSACSSRTRLAWKSIHFQVGRFETSNLPNSNLTLTAKCKFFLEVHLQILIQCVCQLVTIGPKIFVNRYTSVLRL